MSLFSLRVSFLHEPLAVGDLVSVVDVRNLRLLINSDRYNSAVFSTLSANDYQVAVVTESFLEGAPFNSSLAPSRHLDSMFRWFDGRPNAFPHLEMRKDINSLQKLENADCMRAYSNKYVADRRNVLAVTESSLSFPTNGSLLTYSLRTAAGGIYPDPRVWLCRFIEVEKGSTWVVKECDVDSAIRQSSDWTIEDYPIQYCLSERTEAHCKLQYSLTIMIVVIICNATKAVCMIALLLSQKEETLVTLGYALPNPSSLHPQASSYYVDNSDAVSSFLEMPDSTTVACCTFDRDDFRRLPPGTATAPRPWRSKRHLWFNSCSLKRWVTCIGLCVEDRITHKTSANLPLDA